MKHLPTLLRKRLPNRDALFTVFLLSALPLYISSIIVFFYKLPSFILWLEIPKIIAVFAYMQIFATLEGLLFWGIVTLLAMILPRCLILDLFIPQATTLILVTALWMIPIHYRSDIISILSLSGKESFAKTWMVSYLGALFSLSIFLRLSSKFRVAAQTFAEKASIPSAFYLLITVIGFIITVIRYVASILL